MAGFGTSFLLQKPITKASLINCIITSVTTHRFFIPSSCIDQNWVTMPNEISQQICKVLRLDVGDAVIVLDNSGFQYTVILSQVNPKTVAGKITSKLENRAEPETKISLYQALIPREKFETVLQKGTEIGIDRFVPLETKRTLIKKNTYGEQKLTRWTRIVQESSEQSERGFIPEIVSPTSFKEAILEAVKSDVALLAAERESSGGSPGLLALLENSKKVSLFIGPEGGFEDSELEFAQKAGVKLINLGPRIFRSETAGLVLATLVLFSTGDLG
ncbi:hypothetical protein A2631_00700 [Candidatus Daviesbacteria bacterium RIFCSPHIGHO2_01_FULL_44_29]|uniref:Ribosomal RNA small subunit methyltransferase E n=1 Tax=Candidatus Daviesbacteria bacterium RIFCSPHIGHO2_02_FULL_43_12 TaxID=1797776 RepID=A0A1F5KI02_9BACT|nr:MAG: hypothetical protein A2631_00700 [Candidatus Daviesbacteria bacterium RIFCSPHIGHO2_01_FULL_44_29]OGE40241.1 MAG: hypothetical protein A3D25_05165 [Candidatus Daviesbacteria bacterium RIFCSPHIGHO2_02_FULL_43_12]